MIKYSILMLTHNRLAEVKRCFESLENTLLRQDVACAVLDNASTDDTYPYLCYESPIKFYDGAIFVKHLLRLLVRSDANLGVAGGRTELLKAAQGEYVVFLDSDTIIRDDNWLDVLGKVLDENENIGMVGPFGSFVLPDWSGFTAARPNAECDVVAGACQVFRRELLDLGVRIDTETFAKFWHEDADMCLSIRSMGWDIWCAPVEISHYPAHSGYGQDKDLHDKNFAAFRSKWQGKGLVKCEGAY